MTPAWSQALVIELAFDPEPRRIRSHLIDRDRAWRDDPVGFVVAIRAYPRNVRRRLFTIPLERGANCLFCQVDKIRGFEGADPGKNLEWVPTLTGLLDGPGDGRPGQKTEALQILRSQRLQLSSTPVPSGLSVGAGVQS